MNQPQIPIDPQAVANELALQRNLANDNAAMGAGALAAAQQMLQAAQAEIQRLKSKKGLAAENAQLRAEVERLKVANAASAKKPPKS